MMRKFNSYSIVAIFILFFILTYSILIAPFSVTVTENTFDIFEGEEKVKIIFISDLHLSPYNPSYSINPWYLQGVIKIIEEQNPDILLIGGDVVDGSPDDLEKLEILKELSSKYKIYAVLGNHDYNTIVQLPCDATKNLNYADAVEEKLGEIGITVLRNEHELLNISNNEFALVGVDDKWACKNDYNKAVQNLSDDLPKIILTHNQNSLDYGNLEGENLILAGHTHCGQVQLPIIGSIPKLLGFKGDVVGGKKEIDEDTGIYVSCGITPGNIRFLTTPEISVIYLE